MGKSVLMMGLKQTPQSMDALTHPAKEEMYKYTPENIKKLAEGELAKIREAGFHVETFGIDVDSKDVLEETRQAVTSRQWDGISIGFGVRGTAELTPLFTDVVNMIVAEVKPTPKLMFALKPDALLVEVQRAFPEGA